MKHLKSYKLFENISNLEDIKLEDVIGSVEDYIYKTFNSNNDYDDPYGCESKNMLIDDMSLDDLWSEYNIDSNDKYFWKSKNFIKMMKDENCHLSLISKFNNIKDRLKNNIKDNKIFIWRCIAINNDFFEDLIKGKIKNIGKYWTYDKNSAKLQMVKNIKNFDKKIVLEANTNINNIDWKLTILYNLNYFVGYSEAEIRLKKDSILNGTKIYYQNNPKDNFFPWYDKKLYSEKDINIILKI